MTFSSHSCDVLSKVSYLHVFLIGTPLRKLKPDRSWKGCKRSNGSEESEEPIELEEPEEPDVVEVPDEAAWLSKSAKKDRTLAI